MQQVQGCGWQLPGVARGQRAERGSNFKREKSMSFIKNMRVQLKRGGTVYI